MGVFKVAMGVRLLRELLERVENAVCAGIDGDWRTIAPCDRALAIQHKERAFADALGGAISMEFPGDFALGLKICEQGEVQVAIARKGCVAPHPVNRDSQEFGVVLVKFGQKLVVEGDLIAAHRAPVCRVESDDDILSLEIRQSQVLTGRYPKREIRGGSAGT